MGSIEAIRFPHSDVALNVKQGVPWFKYGLTIGDDAKGMIAGAGPTAPVSIGGYVQGAYWMGTAAAVPGAPECGCVF